MKFDLVQCTVRVPFEGKYGESEIVKAGPAAITAAELVILRRKFDLEGMGYGPDTCSIRNARVVGMVDRHPDEEHQRLCQIHGSKIVRAMYPRGSGMAATLEDCELPAECIATVPASQTAKPRQSPHAIREEKKKIAGELIELGVEVPETATLKELKELLSEKI